MFPLRDTVPSRHAPVMTLLLISVNVIVFFFELTLDPHRIPALFLEFGIVPARFGSASPAGYASLLTSMFLHGGWAHVIGNMWTLWIFGDNVEDRMGPFRFLIFYLLCGVIAGVVHVVSSAGSTVPTVGASGAIAGVMGAYFLMFPGARILMLLPVFFYPLFFEIPAYLFLGYWFLAQIFSGSLALASPGQIGGVAWWAHGGGFLAGVLLHALFRRRPALSQAP